MGRGCAQLGKAVKGKSKERKKERKPLGGKAAAGAGAAGDAQLGEDVRALEEYEKMHKLAEAQRQRLKKLLQQEQSNTALNKKLLNHLYRAVMRMEKVDLLRREIDVVAQNHTRDVDRKDHIIHMLGQDCEDADEQFQTAQRAHMDRLSKLVALNGRKLATLESEFERDLKALKLEFSTERAHLVATHARETRQMANVMAAVEAEEHERILEARQAHETEREEIRNKNLEGINELRIALENKIEELERQFDDAHAAYVDQTAAANESFKKLKAEDAALSLHIFEKKKKIVRLQANLASWRKKLDYNARECVARNAQLREQKEAIAKHCHTLKAKMARFRASESKRLTELTVLSREALQANQANLAQAERLLALAELSRKMETEREKVTPFYESTNIAALQQQGGATAAAAAAAANAAAAGGLASTVKARAGLDSEQKEQDSAAAVAASIAADAEAGMAAMYSAVRLGGAIPTAYHSEGSIGPSGAVVSGQPVDEWGLLDNFYKKYNRVLLDKLAVAQEKKRLQSENAALRQLLQQYLDGVAITATAVDQDNPLLIVNGRIALVDGPQVRRGRPRITQELGQLVQSTKVHQGTAQYQQTQQRMQMHG